MKNLHYKRKNIVIFSLVMMLGVIGYINYNLNRHSLMQTADDLGQYEMMMLEETNLVTNLDIEEEMDNAIIVDSLDSNVVTEVAKTTSVEIKQVIADEKSMKSTTFFIESKLHRDKKRSEMISNLNEIINNQLTSENIRTQAQETKLLVIVNTEREMLVENMIVAKGFTDAIVYISDQRINIVVNTASLNEEDVAKIVDIVKRETEITLDNIIIMNRN
ncbi:MAG: stage III sporulation protein AH [Alkaliphilus sp.]|nr:SpoIIIAH-like family protein [Alkaliphilus sp. AH-315-G20]PHS36515.1 MAG: stage III sporulation protein AH [Alkaliphilus sp.]